MWNGTEMVLMATYDNAIDNVPTAGSDNLVKSNGVKIYTDQTIDDAINNYTHRLLVKSEYADASITRGYYLNEYGAKQANSSWCYTDFIDIRTGLLYVKLPSGGQFGGGAIIFYDKNYNQTYANRGNSIAYSQGNNIYMIYQHSSDDCFVKLSISGITGQTFEYSKLSSPYLNEEMTEVVASIEFGKKITGNSIFRNMGYVVYSNGEVELSHSYYSTVMIPIKSNEIHGYFEGSSPIAVIAAYDSDGNYIQSESVKGSGTGKFLRYRPSKNVAFVKLCTAASNIASFYVYFENAVVNTANGENLFDIASPNIIKNSYMGADGVINSNNSLSISDYIPVEEGCYYTFNSDYEHDNYARFITAFDKNLNAVVEAGKNSPTSEYFVTEGVCFIRLTFYNAANWIVFGKGVFKGNVAFEKKIGSEFLNHAAVQGATNFKKFQSVNGDMGNGDYLKLDANSIKTNKALAFTATVTSFTSLLLGHGENIEGGDYIEITGTQVRQYHSGVAMTPIAHEITISENIQVSMIVRENYKCVLKLVSSGEIFTTEINHWGGCHGDIFAKSVGSVLTDCHLSWSCDGYAKKVQLYGDSYISYDAPSRWTYYLIQDGFGCNVLMDGYGGKGSVEALKTLQMNLQYSNPELIIWALGMNDPDAIGSEPSSPNNSWLSSMRSFLSICKVYNITPILCTIPNVVGVGTGVYHHEKKNEWVRNSGYNYIDFDKAVGANVNGQWYPGMLSGDGIHPDVKGAVTLYMEAISTVSQLMNK
jgi:hypothetical protein